VTPEDELQRRLAFPDTALPEDEDADTVDVDQRPVQRDRGGQAILEEAAEEIERPLGRAGGDQEGQAVPLRGVDQVRVGVGPVRQEQARGGGRGEAIEQQTARLRWQTLEVADLAAPQNLERPRLKRLGLPGE